MELEVLHEKHSTSEGVDTEEDKLKESDAGNKPGWRPPHDLLTLLHHVEVVDQLMLPAKKRRTITKQQKMMEEGKLTSNWILSLGPF